jgi:tetratricopeptide (TPR) repeat protein
LKANHPEAFSAPDPARLQSLAAIGGGSMYDLSRASALSIENRLVDQARDIEIYGRPVPDYKPYPFAAAGLILLAAHQLLPAAIQLLKRRRLRTALASIFLLILTAGMAIKNPSAEFKDALQLASKGKHDEALKKLNVLKLEGGSEEIDVAMGNIYFAKKEIDKAISQYQSALQRNPGNKRARWNWEVSLKSKQNSTPPPPKQPPSQKQATEVPEQTKSLLKYFDQLETEQMKENNIKKKSVETFAW